MKPIKITLKIDATDCFFYNRYLFFVLKDGRISYIPLAEISNKLKDKYSKIYEILNVVLFRYDYFSNQQGEKFFSYKGFQEVFLKNLKKLISIEDIVIDIQDDVINLVEINELPIVDMKIYGQKLYIANRNGLYEMKFNIPTTDRFDFEHGELERIFDSRSSSVNVKYGSIVLSSIRDGLFKGTFKIDSRSSIYEKPIKSKSIKTSWSYVDLINYNNNICLDYLFNDFVTSEKRYFNDYENKIIKNFAYKSVNINENISKNKYVYKDVLSIFNFGTKFYFVKNNGDIYKLSIGRDRKYQVDKDEENDIYISNRINKITKKRKIKGKPVSVNQILDKFLIEYYDSLYLFHGDRIEEIENSSSFTVRSYPYSKSFKNIFSVAKGDSINLYAIYSKEQFY